MITLQAVYTLEQTVEKPQDLSEKFALGRSRGKSDFPEGRSPEVKSLQIQHHLGSTLYEKEH